MQGDGYWVATLNDVALNGVSTQLTSGQVVASLTAYDPARSTFAPNGDVVDPYTWLSLAKPQSESCRAERSPSTGAPGQPTCSCGRATVCASTSVCD